MEGKPTGTRSMWFGWLAAFGLVATGISIGFIVVWIARYTSKSTKNAKTVDSVEQDSPKSDVAAGSHGTAPDVGVDTSTLFADWPAAKPTIALVLSGEMWGYLRPCGCSPGQQGGLARRGSFLEFLKKDRGWNVLPLDLGDLVHQSGMLEQDRYEYALKSLRELGYPVVGVGPTDLSISFNQIMGQAANADPVALVSGSLDNEDRDAWREFIKEIKAVDVGGVKVAVGHMIGESQHGRLMDQSVSIRPAKQIVPALLKTMEEAKADLKVLLAFVPVAEAHQLAAEFPGFDVILCQSGEADSATSEAKMIGNTLVTWVGSKGKSVGVVGFWKEQTPRLRFELVPLDNRFNELKSMNDIYAEFVQTLKKSGYLAKTRKVDHPQKDVYVGAEACGKCHKKAYEKWRGSKHAHAFESLVNAKPPGQEWNPDCVKCHVTGLDYTGGFATPAETPHLAGNQCENCHGPGAKHSQSPRDLAFIEPMKRTVSQVKSQGACQRCHDVENSIHFDFDTYWPKIAHPWKN